MNPARRCIGTLGRVGGNINVPFTVSSHALLAQRPVEGRQSRQEVYPEIGFEHEKSRTFGVAMKNGDHPRMLRFAPRYGMISPCLRRPAGRVPRPANDNPAWSLQAAQDYPSPVRAMAGRLADRLAEDALLAEALRLFASHGHAAAGQAARAATRAAMAGDAEQADWWAQVCHTLDRRKAIALRRELAGLG